MPYTVLLTTVEPLIKDTPYKGHNRIPLHSKEGTTFEHLVWSQMLVFAYLQYICNL